MVLKGIRYYIAEDADSRHKVTKGFSLDYKSSESDRER